MDGKYFIRSLYFDNPADKALREKLDGVNLREKFRLRYYNLDPSLIHLEKKSKQSGLGCKQSADLTPAEAQALVEGRLDWMMDSGRPLIQELYSKMRSQGLRPKTIVDYTPGAVCLRPRQCTDHTGLQRSLRPGLYGFSGSELCNSPHTWRPHYS